MTVPRWEDNLGVMPKTYLSTIQAARQLGCTVHQLRYLLQEGKVSPPKGPAGAFLWCKADVKKAGSILRAKKRQEGSK